MNELHCDKCKRIIGFSNRRNYPKAIHPTIIKCIDCYFLEIKEMMKNG